MTTMTTKNQTTTMPKPAQSGTAAAGTGSVQTLTALTTTTTTTTTAPTKTAPTTTRRWKWSGDTEEPDYDRWNDHDDECTTTYKEHERKLKDAAWNDYAHACDDETTYVPFMNLTKDERDKKGKQFRFGLCCECDAGLASENDFACKSRGGGRVMMCHPCNEYFFNLAY
jgi:hypothetical protein